MSIAAEIAALLGSMPSLDSPPEVRAAWLDRKAALLDRAAEISPSRAPYVDSAGAVGARLRAVTVRPGERGTP